MERSEAMPDVVMTFKGRPYNLTEEPMIIGILNHTPTHFMPVVALRVSEIYTNGLRRSLPKGVR